MSKCNCPFCGNVLNSRYSKCYNIYCQGQEFNVGNKVVYRLNPNLSIGHIIKKLEIPFSKSLDDEDSSFITKFKVSFKEIVKIVHPIDLIHYIFNVNDEIITNNGTAIINSNDFLIRDGLISYEALYSNGKLAQVLETEIISPFETPLEKALSSQEISPPNKFLIKYWANLFHSYYTSYQIKCITNSRLSLMPHQINVAHRLSEEYLPRFILADEVGLGKTIEAGIFIKEMMARQLAERILIIVPATLVKQWQFEMLNKFNINFAFYDGKRIKELKSKGNKKVAGLLENPFYYDNLIICSLQFARNRKYSELLSQISWDIVVFDEAHHLRRYLVNAMTGNFRETLNYALAKNLSLNSESLLLLTATPLQLHSFEIFSLIELIQPEAFDNFGDFEHFRMNMPFINLLVSNVSQIEKLNTFELKNTINLLKELNYVNNKMLNEHALELLNDPTKRAELLDKIEKDHTLSKFLIRNRKKNVFSKDVLSKRIVKTINVNPTKEELDIYKEIRLYLAKIYNSAISKDNVGIGFVIATLQKLLTSSKYAILKSLERRLEQINRLKDISLEANIIKKEDPEYYESELEDEFIDSETNDSFKELLIHEKDDPSLDLLNQEKILKEFREKLKEIPYDSKSDKLIELINQMYAINPIEKVIIFTQFVDTLTYLRDLLKHQNQEFFVEIFYGGMNKEEKDDSVEIFRTNKEFSILISTEIGGEGRNFQFCRILINYDLPWNPMKLEQRIGRLDRIGQEHREIYIYNFYLEGTIETEVLFTLIKRINLFEESIGHLEPIIGNIEKDLKEVIFSVEKEGRKKLNEFTRNLDKEIKKAREIETQLDDLMIDRKSFRMDGLISPLACEEVTLGHGELFLLTKYFLGLDNSKYGNMEIINKLNNPVNKEINFETKIRLSDDLLENPKYNFSKEYIGTFDIELAKRREEIDFFALGHPMIDSILEYCSSQEFSSNFTVLHLKKNALFKDLAHIFAKHDKLYLFIFSIKYQGYIVETQLSTIVVDENGNEIENLAHYILNIENYGNIFMFDTQDANKVELEQNFLENLTIKAKKLVKLKTTNWKKEIKRLNNKIFNLETVKKEKIYSHKQKVLLIKLESLKLKLEHKINQRPSERQKQNITDLTDKLKKKERLDKIKQLEEEIQFLEKDISKIQKKLDDLSFDYEDLKKEMNKRNLNKYYTNLLGFAILSCN